MTKVISKENGGKREPYEQYLLRKRQKDIKNKCPKNQAGKTKEETPSDKAQGNIGSSFSITT